MRYVDAAIIGGICCICHIIVIEPHWGSSVGHPNRTRWLRMNGHSNAQRCPIFFCRYRYDDTRILSEQCGGRIPRVPDFEYERHVFARPEQMHVDRVHHENVRNQITLTPEDQAELQILAQRPPIVCNHKHTAKHTAQQDTKSHGPFEREGIQQIYLLRRGKLTTTRGLRPSFFFDHKLSKPQTYFWAVDKRQKYGISIRI